VAPFFLTGEVSLPFLAGLLLPALGFLCHCLLSPPSHLGCWRERSRARVCGCRLARSPRPALYARRHFPYLAHSPSWAGLGRV